MKRRPNAGEPWTDELRLKARPKRATRTLGAPLRRTAGVFQSQPVANITAFPYSTVGCLFFRQNGAPMFATACVVAKNVVFTAAHNLWDEGVVSTDVVFELQFANGAGVGSWTPDPEHIVIPAEWQTQRTATFDFAAFRTTADLPVAASGVLVPHLSSGLPAETACLAIGYPDGKVMWETEGPLDYAMSFLSQMESDLGAGAGGGPWLAKLAGASAFIGVTAQNYPDLDVLIAPPFNNSVQEVISTAGGCSSS